jgi:hypothetical protein
LLYPIFAQNHAIMTKLQLIKLVLLVLCPFFLLGQTSDKQLTKLTYDQIKKLYYDNEKSKSKQLEYANAYVLKAKNENKAIEKARGWYLISKKCPGIRAIQYLDSAIVVSKDENDKKYPAYAYSAKGHELRKLFRFREALDNFWFFA